MHGSPTTHRNYKGHQGTSRDTDAVVVAVVVAPLSLLPLLPCNRVVRKTHTSLIVARNLLYAAMGETNTIDPPLLGTSGCGLEEKWHQKELS